MTAQAGFLEEATLELSLKGAWPVGQRERVPVSILTFPEGRGSCSFALGRRPVAEHWLTSWEERGCF